MGIGLLIVGVSFISVSASAEEEYVKEMEVEVGSVVELGIIDEVTDCSATNDVTDTTILLHEEGDCTVVLDTGQKVHINAVSSESDVVLSDEDGLIEDCGEEEIIDNTPEIFVEDIEDVSYMFENYETSSVEVSEEKEIGYLVAEKSEATLSEKRHVGILGTGFFLSVNDGEAVGYSALDKSVLDVYNDGEIRLKKEGYSKVFVETEGGLLKCDVYVINPSIDTSDVAIVEDETYQITIEGELYGAKPTYSILSGEGATVSRDGVVSVPKDVTCTVEIDLCGQKYTKKISCMNYKEKLWKDMQPAIQSCLGTPYVMGGFTPGVALDCSGYVSYVLGTVGKMYGRTSAQGLYNMFPSTSDPEPGDLVFFQGTYNCPDYITHVGIYAGDGMMYHSGSPNQKVAITGYFSQHLVGYGKVN